MAKLNLKSLSDELKKKLQYFNPTSNNGNNFWSSNTAQKISNVQRGVQQMAQPVNRSNQSFPIKTIGQMGERGMFGPIPQFTSFLTKTKPETALPISHFFAGLDTTGLAERAATSGQMLPEREKYGGYRTAGKITSGLIAGGPKAVAKSFGMGTVLGTLGQGASNILNKQPLTKDLSKSALQGGKYGAETSTTFALTNSIVNSLAIKLPFFRPLTDEGIKKTLPTVQMTLNQAVKNIGKTGLKRIIKAAFIETPVEGLVYGVKERGKDQKLIESIVDQTIQNFYYNIAFAGANTLWDSRTIAPIISKSISDTLASPKFQKTSPLASPMNIDQAKNKVGQLLTSIGGFSDATDEGIEILSKRDWKSTNDPRMQEAIKLSRFIKATELGAVVNTPIINIGNTVQDIGADVQKGIKNANVTKAGLYNIITQEGMKKVEGKPIKIVEGIETFIHQGDNPKRTVKGFVISEKTTGRYIGSGETERMAIQDAKNNIETQGVNKLKQALAKYKLESNIAQQPLKEGVEVKTEKALVNQPTSQVPSQTLKFQPKAKVNQTIPVAKPEVASADSSSLYFNTDRLNVTDSSKDFVTKTIEEIKQEIERVSGKKLSNKEVVNFANNSAKVLNSVVSKQETLAWEAKMLKARELLAKQASEGTVTQEYIDNLVAIKSQGTDIARKLQSLSQGADPKEVTAKQAILEAVLKVTKDTEDILNKAKGVDFNNYDQAASFYRQFVKPTASDWLEKVRYSSMLSSPNTHINNSSSNFQGTGIIAPIEKTISGGVDAFLSAVKKGRERTMFAGEGLAYAKGYYSNLGNAWKNFTDTMKGVKISSSQEMYNLPLTEKGTMGRKVENTLSFFPKMLQAEDEFFQTLTESGVKSSLTFRQSKGIKIADIEGKAYLEGRKRLFNAAFGLKEEGYVLKALEYIPQKVAEARNSSNPVISTIAKYTFPFVRIPSNILKASVEYGPLGVATLPGASNKTEQLSKSILGMLIGTAAAVLVGEDRLTWAEPTDEKKRNAARAAGWQPYSVKVGNNYYSYSKMHPSIAFPLALVAAVRDSQKRKLLDDTQVETVMSGVANWVNFYADMSYVKNIGDMVSGVKGDLSAGTRQLSNYTQQMIPFRALMGWITRIVDPYQRKVDPDGGILTKQLESIMTQIPGLSGLVPAREDTKGNPIENPHRFINAISPVKMTTENPEKMKIYNLLVGKSQETRQVNEIKKKVLETGKEQTYNGKKYYPSMELDSKTGEYEPVVKSIKVSQSTSDVYSGLDKEYETSSDSPKNILAKIAVYGTGIFKDPTGTINAIKTGQPIRKVSGDAVIVERLTGLSKLDQGDQATEVDHIIAISLGGTNDESNLAIISKQDNRAKGVVDTYLSDELKAGRITKKVAQERDLNWRNEIENLPSSEKAKAKAILAQTPVKTEVKVNEGILNTLASRTYEPIYNESTQTYSDVQIKIPEMGKLTGFAELDKKTKYTYKSAITTAKNNISKLYLDGQITAKEANDALVALNVQSTGSSSGRTKKPKKITFKATTIKSTPITIKKSAKKVMPTIKFAKPKKSKTKIVRKYSIK